jgi:N-acetylglucosaminyldiphosphoundecaprenol N-acetyl-beta-D-mannosaminyltransferase
MEAEDIVTLSKPKRIYLLNVPLDIADKEQLSYVLGKLITDCETKHIVLLSLWDFLRARRNNAYRDYILKADLVIPISKSLIGGARFLTGNEPVRYMPFNFIITLLSILESRGLSMYFIGAKKKIIEKAENNVKHTFPRLRIVGRHAGHFKRQLEADIFEAIRKASPTLLLAGKGVHGEELWIHRNADKLNCGIRLWCSDIYEIFANRKRHPSDYSFKHGFEWIGFCVKKPFYIFRFFPYMYYKLLLVIYKLFKRKKTQKIENTLK